MKMKLWVYETPTTHSVVFTKNELRATDWVFLGTTEIEVDKPVRIVERQITAARLGDGYPCDVSGSEPIPRNATDIRILYKVPE